MLWLAGGDTKQFYWRQNSHLWKLIGEIALCWYLWEESGRKKVNVLNLKANYLHDKMSSFSKTVIQNSRGDGDWFGIGESWAEAGYLCLWISIYLQKFKMGNAKLFNQRLYLSTFMVLFLPMASLSSISGFSPIIRVRNTII